MKAWAYGAVALLALAVGQPAAAAAEGGATVEYQLDFSGVYFITANPDGFDLANTRMVLTVDELPSMSRIGMMQHRIRGIRGTRNGLDIIGMDLVEHDGPEPEPGDTWPIDVRGEPLKITNDPNLELRYGSKQWLGDIGFQYQTSDGVWYHMNGNFDFDGNDASEVQARATPSDFSSYTVARSH